MAAVTPFLMLIWLPVALLLFSSFRPHQGVIVCLLAGLCLLPVVGGAMAVPEINLTPLHFNKENTICYAVFLAVLVFDAKGLMAFRPRWVDIPMAVWCVCPFFSSLVNPPPPDGSSPYYDGIGQSIAEVVTWGIFYLLGRLYFDKPAPLRDLCLGIVFAALTYVPLCLFEIRFSPQLHYYVYGYIPHEFAQTIRFGGYRPMVFFRHGLVLGMFMSMGTLIAAWLSCNDKGDRLQHQQGWKTGQIGLITLILVPTSILVKSTGAIALGFCGAAVLFLGKLWPLRLWLLPLALVPPLYVVSRVSGAWTGDQAVKLVSVHLDSDRAESLGYRLNAENLLMEKAYEKKWLGWAGWGRNRIRNEEGEDLVGTDGLWILTYGNRGYIGLFTLGAIFLLPVLRFVVLFSPRTWADPLLAPLSVCVVVVLLYQIDYLFNGNVNPIVPLIIGVVASADPKKLVVSSPGATMKLAQDRHQLPRPRWQPLGSWPSRK